MTSYRKRIPIVEKRKKNSEQIFNNLIENFDKKPLNLEVFELLEPVDDQEQFNQRKRTMEAQSRAYLYLPKTPTRLQANQYVSYFDNYQLHNIQTNKNKNANNKKDQSQSEKKGQDNDSQENNNEEEQDDLDNDEKEQEERILLLSNKKNWNKGSVVSMNTCYRYVQQNVAQVLNDSKSDIKKIVEIQEKNKIVRNLSSLDKIFEEARLKNDRESVQTLDLFKKQQLNYDVNKLKLPEIPTLEKIQEKKAAMNKPQSIVNNKSTASILSNTKQITSITKNNISQQDNNLSQSNSQKDQFQNMKDRFQIKLPKNFLLVPLSQKKAKVNSQTNLTKVLKTDFSDIDISNNILTQNTDYTNNNNKINRVNLKKEMNKSQQNFDKSYLKTIKPKQLPKLSKKEFLLDRKLYTNSQKVGGLTLTLMNSPKGQGQDGGNNTQQNQTTNKKIQSFINYRGIDIEMPKYLTPYRDLVLKQWRQNTQPWNKPDKQESNLLSNCIGMLSLQENMQANTQELNNFAIDQTKEFFIVPTQLKINQNKDELQEKFGSEKKNQKEQAYSLVSLLDKLVQVNNPVQVLKGKDDEDN